MRALPVLFAINNINWLEPRPLMEIAITGIGMVSSLGLNAVTSCAAGRAGITRAMELDFHVLNTDTNDLESVIGHAIPTVTGGYEGQGKILRISQLAFDDLQNNSDFSGLNFQRGGLLLALPDFNRSSKGIFADEEESIYQNPLLSSGCAPLPNIDMVAKSIYQFAASYTLQKNVEVIQSGHAGFIYGVQRAISKFQNNEWSFCIIGAFDSLLEPHTLQWLFDHHRLKCEDNTVGLQPGEAGSFILLEPKSTAIHRKVTIQAVLTACATGFETNFLSATKSSFGQGVLQTIQQLYGNFKDNIIEPWVISDLNGEDHRSIEWGNAWIRLTTNFPALKEAKSLSPAAYFGDTGVASGSVNLCFGIWSFARNYSPSTQILLLSSSYTGERGALLIQKHFGA